MHQAQPFAEADLREELSDGLDVATLHAQWLEGRAEETRMRRSSEHAAAWGVDVRLSQGLWCLRLGEGEDCRRR